MFCCDAVCNGDCQSCTLNGKKGNCQVLPKQVTAKGCCNGISAQSDPTCLCHADVDCPTGDFCDCSGHCTMTKQDNGASCQCPIDCKSGFCVDGVCCNVACTGCCETCVIDATHDGGMRGTCLPQPADRDALRCCQPFACDGVHPYCPTPCADDTGCITGACCVNGRCVLAGGDGGTSACNATAVYTGNGCGACAVGARRSDSRPMGPLGAALLLFGLSLFVRSRRRGGSHHE